jgi:hypothetical protein
VPSLLLTGTKESRRGRSEASSVHPLAPGYPVRTVLGSFSSPNNLCGLVMGMVVFTQSSLGLVLITWCVKGVKHQDGTRVSSFHRFSFSASSSSGPPLPHRLTCIGAIRQTTLCSCIVLRGCSEPDERHRFRSTDLTIEYSDVRDTKKCTQMGSDLTATLFRGHSYDGTVPRRL